MLEKRHLCIQYKGPSFARTGIFTESPSLCEFWERSYNSCPCFFFPPPLGTMSLGFQASSHHSSHNSACLTELCHSLYKVQFFEDYLNSAPLFSFEIFLDAWGLKLNALHVCLMDTGFVSFIVLFLWHLWDRNVPSLKIIPVLFSWELSFMVVWFFHLTSHSCLAGSLLKTQWI